MSGIVLNNLYILIHLIFRTALWIIIGTKISSIFQWGNGDTENLTPNCLVWAQVLSQATLLVVSQTVIYIRARNWNPLYTFLLNRQTQCMGKMWNLCKVPFSL